MVLQVNDIVYCTRFRRTGKIVKTDNVGTYPLIVYFSDKIETYTFRGFYTTYDECPSLFKTNNVILARKVKGYR